MLRSAAANDGPVVVDGFRFRGRDVSRIEGFSDAAFAFAMTLLVISMEAPHSYEDLIRLLRGLPAFAVCFATLAWLWWTHYRFFRRYGLTDELTMILNTILMFVVLFYVYPLKFLFELFIGQITRLGSSSSIDISQVGGLFVIYGVGFSAVWGLFAVMNMHALRQADRLELDDLERLMTREEIARTLGLAGVGALSIILAVTLPRGMVSLAGFAYMLIGVVEGVVASRFRRAREKATRPASPDADAPVRPPAPPDD